MALDFPSNPVNGQIYDSYYYDSVMGTWRAQGSGLALNAFVNPTITGGTISGLSTDLAVADGGTGASDAATARTNLGVPPIASPTFTGTTTNAALSVTGGSELNTGKASITRVQMPNGSLISNTGEVNTLQIRQDTVNSDAFMTFHVAGDYAAHFGIDGTTNDLAYGGWSAGANKYRVFHAGNTVPIANGGTGTTNGVGMVRVIPTSVGVNGGTASFNGTTGAITFSAATIVQPNGVFSSSYKYYRVVAQLTASGDVGYGWRLAAGGSWNSNSYYHFVLQWNGGSGYGSSPSNSNSLIGYSLAHKYAAVVMDFINPAVTASTKHMIGHWQGLNAATTANESHSVVGVFRDTGYTADGFALFPSTGNITGTMTVYGYN